MYHYFLWNLPKFFNTKKCLRIFKKLFGIVNLILLPSRCSRDLYHCGCGKLITAHPLNFVRGNCVPINIGTRYPVFIKPDEFTSVFPHTNPSSDRTLRASQNNESDINDFECIFDVLDGFSSSDTVFTIEEKTCMDCSELFASKLTISSNTLQCISPDSPHFDVFCAPDISIPPIIFTASLLESQNLCTNHINAVPSSHLEGLWLKGTSIDIPPSTSNSILQSICYPEIDISPISSPHIGITKNLGSVSCGGIDISPRNCVSCQHDCQRVHGSGKISTAVFICQELINMFWPLDCFKLDRNTIERRIILNFERAHIREKLSFPPAKK